MKSYQLQPPVGPRVEVRRTDSIDRVRRARVLWILHSIMDSKSTPDEAGKP